MQENNDLADFNRFIHNWSKITSSPADRALILIMKHHRADIAPLFATKDPLWIHKAFRQTDVCNGAYTDMVIWHLIHACTDFWDEVNYHFNKDVSPTSKRGLRKQLQEARDEIAELKKSAGLKDSGSE